MSREAAVRALPTPPAQRESWWLPREGGVGRAVVAGVVVGLLVLLAGLGYSFLRPTTHTATSVVALTPRDPSTTTADTVQMLGRSYTAYLSSPEVLGRVAQTAGLSLQQLTDATQIDVAASSANVETSVTLPDPVAASAAADALTAAAAGKASGDRLVSPDVVSTAIPSSTVAHPPRAVLAVASLLAAVLAGLLVAYVVGHRARAAEISRR